MLVCDVRLTQVRKAAYPYIKAHSLLLISAFGSKSRRYYEIIIYRFLYG